VSILLTEGTGNRMSSVKWPEGNLICDLICGYLEQYEEVAERCTALDVGWLIGQLPIIPLTHQVTQLLRCCDEQSRSFGISYLRQRDARYRSIGAEVGRKQWRSQEFATGGA